MILKSQEIKLTSLHQYTGKAKNDIFSIMKNEILQVNVPSTAK